MLKLSIIVPVYNVEKYLPKCIDSLICGDGGYEIILVNDGSTDGSPDILADYAARYPALIGITPRRTADLPATATQALTPPWETTCSLWTATTTSPPTRSVPY